MGILEACVIDYFFPSGAETIKHNTHLFFRYYLAKDEKYSHFKL